MRGVLAAAVCLALIAGCTARQAAIPAPSTAELRALPTAADLVRASTARRLAVHSVRAQARLLYTSPAESQRAKQVLLAARPDRLRLEVLSPFGAVFVMTTRDGVLTAWDRGEATVYRGEASADNLERYAHVDLPISTAVDILLGTPPIDPAADSAVAAEGGRIRLWQEHNDRIQVTWFTPGLDPISFEEQDMHGHVLLRATFEGYTDVPGGRIPMLISLEQPTLERRIDIELRDPEVNPQLAETAFALETPPGNKEIDLDQVVN